MARWNVFMAAFSLLAFEGCGQQAEPPADVKSFLKAVEDNDLAKVRAGLKVNPKWVNAADGPRIALHLAVLRGHLPMVKLLVASGADVNARGRNGWTALLYAVTGVTRNDKAAATFLIAKGADVNAKDNDGQTPLHWAAKMGHKDMAELLIAKGAAVNASDNKGKTPLTEARSRGQQDLMALLRKHGAKE